MALKQMEPTKETVGGYNFYIKPFAAFKAANLTGELASVLAPLLGALAPLVSDQKEGSLMDVDAAQAAEALSNCTNISGDKMEKLMQKLLLGGHIVVELPDEEGEFKPERLDMDIANEIFCGEVQDMFILCFHVIKLNFNGFFKKIAGLSGKAGLAIPKKPRKVI
ncbi:hypothetical protein NSB25_11345 [Acetatifactor muris]|uniref:Uncharacterized protein n=1 Tax=Acetatifactor muris TaxID=879566 RepID=A0A2K4ZGW7_9FIRM|nr:hypothetical protein [Acetatifactor muris]MCR2047879.1 hypothetical protein [Acetatifactor muris]SOY29682.1 hypothetical protein AMURIS_02403 [Acetatifactor muris]